MNESMRASLREFVDTCVISPLAGVGVCEVIFQVRVGVLPPISRYRETS